MAHVDPILHQIRSLQASDSAVSIVDGANDTVTSDNAATASTSTPNSVNGELVDGNPTEASASSSGQQDSIKSSNPDETPKPSRKRRRVMKQIKISDKKYVTDDCSTSKATLEKARQNLPKKHDIKLRLESLVSFPFYRQIDPEYVKRIIALLDQKLFDLKRTTFTVCEDPASGKYLVLNGNHRVTGLLQKFGKDFDYEFDCIVYGALSKDQMFSICLALTEPPMILEMRFLDQISIFRKFRLARGLHKSEKVYDEQLDLGGCLVGKPNPFAIEIAQWSDEDYEMVTSYIMEFQNSKIREHPDRAHIHYSNLTEDGKLPDLKSGIFWKSVMQGCKTDKKYTLSLMKKQADDSYLTLHEVKEGAKKQPKFLLRLKRMGIEYDTLEAASKDLCNGVVYSDKVLMEAVNNRAHLAHIGQDGKPCTVANLKRKLQLVISPTQSISDKLVEFSSDRFASDLVFVKFAVICMDYVDHVTLLKTMASMESDSTLILLGPFNLSEVCRTLACNKPTVTSLVMLQERFCDTVVSEPHDNALLVSMFVKQDDKIVPLDVAFDNNFCNLPLNHILSPLSMETLFAAAASRYSLMASTFLFVLPPLTKLDQTWKSFAQFKQCENSRFYVHGEAHGKQFMTYINDAIANSNVCADQPASSSPVQQAAASPSSSSQTEDSSSTRFSTSPEVQSPS